MKKAMLVIGCRPNFMKAAPLLEELKKDGTFETILVHTGQHYDDNMSTVFFKDLDMPRANYYLYNTRELDDVIKKEEPDFVVVFGDVNSTADSAIIASRLGVPVVHVEAGLRSFNKKMAEENNRIITDHISDLLFTTEMSGNSNLTAEGIGADKVFLVGSLMIDTLMKYTEEAKMRKKRRGNYCVLTLHRAENVDDREVLKDLLRIFKEIQDDITVVWPLHPRTKKMIKQFGLNTDGLTIIEPLGYLNMINLMMYSRFVMTDSGGIQEETSYLHLPCFVFRHETERPNTLTFGTSVLVGTDRNKILDAIKATPRQRIRSKYADGKTAERIVKRLKDEYEI